MTRFGRRGLLPGVTVCLLTLLGCSTPAADPAAPPAELSIRQLEPGVWIARHEEPYPSNSVLVEMDDASLVLVRTPYTEVHTRALLSWIRRTLGPRTLIAINTHFHWDALGGNRSLREAGIPVYGSDRTADLLRERGGDMRRLMVEWLNDRPEQRSRFETGTLVAPDRLFPLTRGLSLEFKTESLEVIHPGPAHSPDGVVVYFPRRRLLCGDCLVLAGDRIGNRSDAHVSEWPKAIHRLQELNPRVVIPGHGEPGGPELLTRTLKVLESSR